MEIRPVGAALIRPGRRTNGHTDRRTDITKVTGSFRDYANAPNTLITCPDEPLIRRKSSNTRNLYILHLRNDDFNAGSFTLYCSGLMLGSKQFIFTTNTLNIPKIGTET